MNIAILLAAVLMSVTAYVHVVIGGAEVMRPLRDAPLPRVVRAVTNVVWHGVTVMLICLAAGLFWLTWNDNPPLMWMVCAVQIGFAGLFIWYGATQLHSLWLMPQWIVFLGVPALAVFGML